MSDNNTKQTDMNKFLSPMTLHSAHSSFIMCFNYINCNIQCKKICTSMLKINMLNVIGNLEIQEFQDMPRTTSSKRNNSNRFLIGQTMYVIYVLRCRAWCVIFIFAYCAFKQVSILRRNWPAKSSNSGVLALMCTITSIIPLVIIFIYANCIWVHAFFTEHEISLLRRQVADRELQPDEELYVEETIATNILLAQQLRDRRSGHSRHFNVDGVNEGDIESGEISVETGWGSKHTVQELERMLEDNFFELRDYVSSKPISTRKESRNRMLTQASLRTKARLRRMLQEHQQYLVDTEKENQQIAMLNSMLEELLSRVPVYNGIISDTEQSDLLAKIHQFYELEHARVVMQLPPSHPDAKVCVWLCSPTCMLQLNTINTMSWYYRQYLN